jgi:hypothetical protein
MGKSLKRSLPYIDLDAKLAFSFTTADDNDLPKFDDTKRMNCPGSTTIKDVVAFAHQKVHFDRHIILP